VVSSAADVNFAHINGRFSSMEIAKAWFSQINEKGNDVLIPPPAELIDELEQSE